MVQLKGGGICEVNFGYNVKKEVYANSSLDLPKLERREKEHTRQMGKSKYFLIYIDILGFVERAKIEADKSIRPEERRKIYQERITHKLSQLKENETVLDFKKMGVDSWLLFTDSIRKAFRSIGEILKTDLPFEIAIGAKKFDESPAVGELITLRNETMDYLKTNILSPYSFIISDSFFLYINTYQRVIFDGFSYVFRTIGHQSIDKICKSANKINCPMKSACRKNKSRKVLSKFLQDA